MTLGSTFCGEATSFAQEMNRSVSSGPKAVVAKLSCSHIIVCDKSFAPHVWTHNFVHTYSNAVLEVAPRSSGNRLSLDARS